MKEREPCLVGHLLPAAGLVHVLCAAGCQPARGKEPKIPPGSGGMVFLVALWVAVCPEWVAGTAAAARYVGAVSGGLLLTLACFLLLQSHFEELVVVEGVAGDSQVCSKGEV